MKKKSIIFLLLMCFFACTNKQDRDSKFTLENPKLVSKQDVKLPLRSQGILILNSEEGKYFEGLFIRNPQHAYYVIIEKSLLIKNNFVINCCKDSNNSHVADTLKNIELEITKQNKFSLGYKNIDIYEVSNIAKR